MNNFKVRLKKTCLILVTLGMMGAYSAQGAIFGNDEEARRQVDFLRQQLTQQQQINANLTARLERLETTLQGGQSPMELANQVDTLRSELAKLQGKNDMLVQEINNLQRRQQETTIDLESKIRNLNYKNTTNNSSNNNVNQNPPLNTNQANNGGEFPNLNSGQNSNNYYNKDKKPLTPPLNSKKPAPIAGKQADLAGSGEDTTLPSAIKPTTTKLPVASDKKTEEQQYKTAYDLFSQGQYQNSMIEFKKFVETYPKSNLVPSALYWIGNGFAKLKDYQSAVTIQQRLVSQFPKAPKVPDALLNIGMAQLALEDKDSARKTFQQIIAKYPKTAIAEKAKQRLDNIQ